MVIFDPHLCINFKNFIEGSIFVWKDRGGVKEQRVGCRGLASCGVRISGWSFLVCSRVSSVLEGLVTERVIGDKVVL